MEEKGLYYYYGSMSSGKSTALLQRSFNYKQRGYDVLIFTSALDGRDGYGKVTSRIGINADAIMIPTDDVSTLQDFKIHLKNNDYKAVFVDECQFLTKEQIDILGEYVDEFDIPVFCYGIRTDFESNLFSGSARLFEIADTIEELKNICKCGRNAIFNARLIDSTEKVLIGGNDIYETMCRSCYREFLKKNKKSGKSDKND